MPAMDKIIYTASYIAVLSLFTFFMYWKDKRAAIKDKDRTPEKTLHLLSLLGGWPGALLAQKKFRHKTKKIRFKIVFWLTVLLNICAAIFIFTGFGGIFK